MYVTHYVIDAHCETYLLHLNGLIKSAEENLDMSFTVDKEYLYQIDDTFPKILRTSLANEIDEVEYSLNPSKLERYLCTKSLAEFLKDVWSGSN